LELNSAIGSFILQQTEFHSTHRRSSAIKAPESRHHRDIPDDQMSQAKTKGGHHEMTSKPIIKACDFLKIIFN